jgi:DNA-binding transcriptional regulator YhcF (GntR family)
VSSGLSAGDVEVHLGERIVRGFYPPGSTLPPTRDLAAELGTSASTVSRALRGLQEQGLLLVVLRTGATVARSLPENVVLRSDLAGRIRTVVATARRAGLGVDDVRSLVDTVIAATYEAPRRLVFVECNPADLASMGAQVAAALGREVEPVDLHDVQHDDVRSGVKDATVVVPLFHLAEVQQALPDHPQVIGVNFVPSEAVVVAVAELPPSATVAVVGTDLRSQRRLEALARQYAPGSIRSTHLGQPVKVAATIMGADAVITVHSAVIDPELLASKRLIEVAFVLDEPNLSSKLG